MILSDNTTTAEGLGDFLKNLGNKRLNVPKKLAEIVLKNRRRALEIGAEQTLVVLSQVEILNRLHQHYQR